MARPHRPNPYTGTRTREEGKARHWHSTHVRQETRAEMKARKRAEAEARNAETPPERTRAFRREALRKAAQEASAWVA